MQGSPPEKYGELEIEVFEALFPELRGGVLEVEDPLESVFELGHDWELPWPFTSVQDFFQELWNSLLEFISTSIDQILRSIGPVIQAVADAVNNLLNWTWNNVIKPSIDWIHDNIINNMWTLWNDYISPAINNIAGTVWGYLTDFYVRQIQPGLQWLLEEINNALKWLYENMIKPGLDWTWNNVVKPAIDGIDSFLHDEFPRLSALGREAVSRAQETLNEIRERVQPAIGDVITALDGARDQIDQNIKNMVGDVLSGFNNLMTSLPQIVGEGFKDVMKWLASTFGEIVGSLGSFLDKGVIEPLVNAFKWVQDLFSKLFLDLWNNLVAKVKGGSPMEPQEALSLIPSVVVPLAFGSILTVGVLDLLSTKLAGSGFDFSGVKEWVNRILHPDIIGNVTIGVLLGVGIQEPLRQFFKEQFRTTLPNVAEAFQMMWRGKLSEEEVRTILARIGFKDEYIDGYFEIYKRMPGPSDLISFIVKEAHEEYKQVEFPEQLAEWLRMQGMEEKWAKLYWGAHWQLPSVEQVFEMMYRGLISPDEMRAFLKEADYEPRWRDKLIGISYKLPDRITARWALEWGVWDEARFTEFLKAEGYDPQWIPDIVKIEKANVFREHLNAIKSVMVRAFREGFLDEAGLRRGLQEAGFPEEAVNLIIASAKREAQFDLMADVKSAYISAYKSGKIDDSTFIELMTSLGVTPERAEEYVRFLSSAVNLKPVTKPTVSWQIEQLKHRIKQLELKLLDLQTDLEQRRAELEQAKRVWEAKLRRYEAQLEATTDEAKRQKLELYIAELKERMKLDLLVREGRVREVEEAIKQIEAKIEELKDELEIKQGAMSQAPAG